MKEEFIAFLWKHRLLQTGLYAVTGESLDIVHPGTENHDAGPDFLVARVRIGQMLWVGNVEIHVRSSDWLKHGHEHNPAYDNIILHVVYVWDKNIKTLKGEDIPVLEIKDRFNPELYRQYLQLKHSERSITCGSQLAKTDPFLISHWLNRLLVERLEQKSREILAFYAYFTYNWEQTFYYFLARNFGFRINAMAFGLLAQRTPLSLLMRKRDQLSVLESILFGQAGMLDCGWEDAYPKYLQAMYRFYQQLYALKPVSNAIWHFARMRPNNFPGIRIAQFAMLLHTGKNLSEYITSGHLINYHSAFRLGTSAYWETHYRFDVSAACKQKIMGSQSIDNIIINTIAPCLFAWSKERNNQPGIERAIALIGNTAAENNRHIRQWKAYGIQPHNAGDSQALLHLKKHYCLPGKCLYCAIGNHLLRRGENGF